MIQQKDKRSGGKDTQEMQMSLLDTSYNSPTNIMFPAAGKFLFLNIL